MSKLNTFNINQQNYNKDEFSSNIDIDHKHRLKQLIDHLNQSYIT